MPKKSIKAEIKTFVQGLITEASPLNFPQNASVSEQNFILNTDGTRERRKGFNLDPMLPPQTTAMTPITVSQGLLKTYEWVNAGGIAGYTVVVAQMESVLRFYHLGAVVSEYLGELNISSIGTIIEGLSFASVNGRLIIAGGLANIGVVEYKLGVFSFSLKRLLTRDVWGVVTGSSADQKAVEDDATFRPYYNLSEAYNYNLYNQGWGIPRTVDVLGTVEDVVEHVALDTGKYPSYSDVIWTLLQFQAKNGVVPPNEKVFTNLFRETTGATGVAAKGSFIIDVLDRSTSRNQAIANNKIKYTEATFASYAAPQDQTTGGASVVTEFSGRVFYSGFNGYTLGGDERSPTLSNYVFFSQLVQSTSDINKCYQEGDPTSREANDIVDTDGGFIRIVGCGSILKLLAIGSALLVFATNGVWSILGGSDYGFSATNYKVDKITSFGCIGANTVLDYSGAAFMWSSDGIYILNQDQMGKWNAESITKTTIQKLYDAIDVNSKARCIGYSDTQGRKLRWLITEGLVAANTFTQRELIFDTTLKAFSVNVIGTTSNYIAGIVRVYPSLSVKYFVTYMSLGSRYVSFASYNDSSFKDWSSLIVGGIDAKAFLLTGAITGEDSSVAKQVPYLTMHFRRTEDSVNLAGVPQNQSGCLIRSQWDWANTAAANKWGPLTQAYRYRRAFYPETVYSGYDTGYELVTSRNKLRGRGKAFALYLETEPGKDCKIVGWNININGNSQT